MIKTKLKIIAELEDVYKRWMTNNELPSPKGLTILGNKYIFRSPSELYQFIKGARLFVED
jgi:hypothetical protein